MSVASYIDHTILKPTCTIADIEQLCAEAIEYGFTAVCVPPYYVAQATELLRGTTVQIATVIGFPFGYSDTGAKLKEIEQAIADGATELDMVHNLAALKNKDYNYLVQEMEACTCAIHAAGKIIKVIVESGELKDEEITTCCELYAPIGIDYMKTSTGYASSGASLHAVQLMRSHLPATIHIKASGGIRDYAFAQQLIAAGADRLGCSASVAIVAQEQSMA
jgi:deoxyribose-phosphate aldolase